LTCNIYCKLKTIQSHWKNNYLDVQLTSAPWSINSLTHLTWPWYTARWSGVSPSFSCTFCFAPVKYSTRYNTILSVHDRHFFPGWNLAIRIYKKIDIVVYLQCFNHLKKVKLHLHFGQKLWGLEPGTSQAAISKQECRSTYFSEMFTIMNQHWNYVCLPNSWYTSLIYLYYSIFLFFISMHSDPKESILQQNILTVI